MLIYEDKILKEFICIIYCFKKLRINSLTVANIIIIVTFILFTHIWIF